MRAIGYSSNRDIFEALGYVEKVKKYNSKNLLDRTIAEDLIDKKNGEVLREAGCRLNKSDCDLIMKMDLKQISLIKKDVHGIEIEMLMNTFKKDPTSSTDEALLLLYQHLRTGEAPSIDISRKFIEKMFFSTKKYDLGQVGRYRINKKFDLDAPVDEPVLIKDDFVEVLKYLIEMRKGDRFPDDIDHLGNRRVRTVGEQLSNQFSIAISRMQRTIRERMNQRV